MFALNQPRAALDIPAEPLTGLAVSLWRASRALDRSAVAAQGIQDPGTKPQSGPSNRAATTSVRVDMYASRDGQPIEDLKADEVELLEDGVVQKVDAFEHVRVGAPGTTESAAHARVFVIFLDTYHTQIEDSARMRLPLIKFLDRVIGPDDMVAVMTPELSASEMTFGKKATLISNIMQADWAWARRGQQDRKDQKESLYDACYPPARGAPGPAEEMKARRREKLSLDALDDLVTRIGGLREERKAVLTISDGWVLFKENKSLLTSSKGRDDTALVDRLLRRPRPKSEDTSGPKEVNRIECDTDREALAVLDHSGRLRALSEYANRGNVSFYSLYARAMENTETPSETTQKRSPEPRGAASRQDSLRFLADNTDGLAVMTSTSVEAAIGKIVDDQSSYYLIGYTSSNTKLDGRFRSVTIRVKRDNVKVRTRRGYRGSTAEELVSSTNASTMPRPGASTASPPVAPNARAPFRIRTSAWLRDSTGSEGPVGAFWIVGELDYRTRRELAWTAGAQAEIVVLGADGTQVISRTIDLQSSDTPFVIQVPESGGIASGEYAVSVHIRSQADPKIELSDTSRVVMRDESPLGQAVIWHRGPSTGPQYLRTADPRFSRSDRVRLELATSSPSPATARMLDRNGNELSVPVQVSDRTDPSSNIRWLVLDAVLAPLTAGDYAIEVTQGRAKRVTDFKLVP
jgi:VWFA-related protein